MLKIKIRNICKFNRMKVREVLEAGLTSAESGRIVEI